MYVQGRDYNCKGTSCYGIGIPAQVLTRLQQVTNTALLYLKIPLAQLKVDGLIGPGTLTALLEIGKRVPGSALSALRSSPSVQVAAQYASELVAEVQAIPSMATGGPPASPPLPTTPPKLPVPVPQAPIPTTTTVPTPTPGPTFPQTVPLPSQTATAPPPNDYGKYWIWGGAALVVGLVITVGVYVRGRLHPP